MFAINLVCGTLSMTLAFSVFTDFKTFFRFSRVGLLVVLIFFLLYPAEGKNNNIPKHLVEESTLITKCNEKAILIRYKRYFLHLLGSENILNQRGMKISLP